jgi:small GTP-binding protein
MDQRKTSCKIVLLGNSGVGKTSLVTRWTSGTFESQIGLTIGANHQRKTIRILGEPVDLFLWDTAGQEQFQALTPLYAHSAATAIIVVAIDQLDSFKGISTWMDLLSRSCDVQPPIILLVNKIDKTERVAFEREDIRERYGASFAGLFFVSAVTGEGVDTAFCCAGERACEFLQSVNTAKIQVDLNRANENKECC